MTKMDKNLPRICPGKIAVFDVSLYLYGVGAKSDKTATWGVRITVSPYSAILVHVLVGVGFSGLCRPYSI